jgi:hypothetical protein
VKETKRDPHDREHTLRDKQRENVHHLVIVVTGFVCLHSELHLQNVGF